MTELIWSCIMNEFDPMKPKGISFRRGSVSFSFNFATNFYGIVALKLFMFKFQTVLKCAATWL